MINQTTINATDNTPLLVNSWIPENVEVVLLIIHGLGEHSQRYDQVANFFNERKTAVFGMDLRGHGKSGGKRGHTPSYGQLMEDIEQGMIQARSAYPNLPLFIYGHSLGGNLVTNFLLRKNVSELAGAIISAPQCAKAVTPNATPKITIKSVAEGILEMLRL